MGDEDKTGEQGTGDAQVKAEQDTAAAPVVIPDAPAPSAEPVILSDSEKINQVVGIVKHIAARTGLLDEMKPLFTALQ